MDFKKFSLATKCEVGIIITSDKKIRDLNKNYRNKDKATDVLSFSFVEGSVPKKLKIADGNPILGEIVISLETTIRQAKEYKVNPYQELLRLLIHGLLHLAGYDHENVSKVRADKMRRLEDKIYARHLKQAKNLI